MSNYFVMRKNDWICGQIMSRSMSTHGGGVKVLVKYVISADESDPEFGYDYNPDGIEDDSEIDEHCNKYNDFQDIRILAATESFKDARKLLRKDLLRELKTEGPGQFPDLKDKISSLLETPDLTLEQITEFADKIHYDRTGLHANFYMNNTKHRVQIALGFNLIVYRIFRVKNFSLPLSLEVVLNKDEYDGKMTYDEDFVSVKLNTVPQLKTKLLQTMYLGPRSIDKSLSLTDFVKALPSDNDGMFVVYHTRSEIKLASSRGDTEITYHLFDQITVIRSLHQELLRWRKAVEQTAHLAGLQRKDLFAGKNDGAFGASTPKCPP